MAAATNDGGAKAGAVRIGALSLANPVALAPMSGVSDLPFRRLAHKLGAGLVVSEMVASRELMVISGVLPTWERRFLSIAISVIFL